MIKLKLELTNFREDQNWVQPILLFLDKLEDILLLKNLNLILDTFLEDVLFDGMYYTDKSIIPSKIQRNLHIYTLKQVLHAFITGATCNQRIFKLHNIAMEYNELAYGMSIKCPIVDVHTGIVGYSGRIFTHQCYDHNVRECNEILITDVTERLKNLRSNNQDFYLKNLSKEQLEDNILFRRI